MLKVIANNFVKYLLLVLCLGGSSSMFAATEYKIIDLGTLEADQSTTYAINERCYVAGSYMVAGKKYSFLWHYSEGLTLTDLPQSAVPKRLNNRNQLAGEYENGRGEKRGFFWDAEQGFVDLGTLGGSRCYVTDMNDHGQIVGRSEMQLLSPVDSRPIEHAFMWENGCMRDLGALVGDLGQSGDRSDAVAINNKGVVVGNSNSLYVHKNKVLRGKEKPFIWSGTKLAEVVTFERGCDNVSVCDINDAGEMLISVFYSTAVNGKGFNHYLLNSHTQRKTNIGAGGWFAPSKIAGENLWHEPTGHVANPYEIRSKSVIGLIKNFGERWTNISGNVHVNAAGIAAGSGTDIFGETHAIVLTPSVDYLKIMK